MASLSLKFALNSFLATTTNGHKYNTSSSSCSFSVFSSQKLRIVAAAAKKDNNNNKNRKIKKEDSHSFVSRPGEATGAFPESVLLKKKKVEEDGQLMPEFADVDERELFEALNLQLESDVYSDLMRHYEVVYLIHENHKEEVENVNIKVQEFLKEKKGKIWRFSDWGLRRLAYKIQKAKSAHYILMNFELEPQWINDFKTLLDKDERVIRHLVMKKDKAETEECPPPPEFNSGHGDMYDSEDDDDEEWDDEEGDDVDGESEEVIIYVDGDDASDTEISSRNMQEAQKVGR